MQRASCCVVGRNMVGYGAMVSFEASQAMEVAGPGYKARRRQKSAALSPLVRVPCFHAIEEILEPPKGGDAPS